MDIPVVPRHLQLLHAEEHQPVKKALAQMWTELARAVNGKLDFGSPQGQAENQTGNIDGVWPGTLVLGYTLLTPAAPNTEFTVTHNLGRIPVGYDVKSRDQAGVVYDSRKTLWTKTQMFLKCDVGSMHLVLFVH